VASTVLLKLSSIGITAIVARILTPHDFGVFAVANTVFTIVVAFGEFGVTSCLARADLRVRDLAPTMWTVSLGSSLVVAAALVFFAEPIAAALGSADGAGPVRVMAIIMILTGVAAVPTGQCVRDFKQNKIFLANMLSFIPSTVVLLVLAKSGDGAMAFAWSRVAGQLTSCVVILVATPKLYLPGISRNALSILYRFGVPLAVANFVGYLLQNVDYALIGHFMGPVLLGTYVIAFNVASWSSSMLVGVLTTVAMPAFSRVRHDTERLMAAMADGVRAVVLIAAPMCALVMVLARPIVLTLYGERWASAANPLAILSLYGLIAIICMLFANMLAALGRSTFLLLVQLVWLIALVPAMALGVHKDGIVGAASAHLVIIIPVVLPCYLFALKRATGVKISMLMNASLPALIAAALAGAIAWVVASELHSPLAQLIAGGTAGGLFYGTVTAPQILTVIGRGKINNPVVRRVMRIYLHIGRSLGLDVGPRPRHARRSRRR
jgi:PST family polysaccharide transporter